MSNQPSSTSRSTAQPSQEFSARADTRSDTIASAAEREALIAARLKPELEMHLTPGGQVETHVKQQINFDTERRIERIGASLNAAQVKMRGNFKNANSNKHTSQDFGQER